MKCRRILASAGVLAMLALSGVVWANLQLSIPQEIEPPFYNSPTGPYFMGDGSFFVMNDGQWAVIPFYRPPENVPTGFNLLSLVDPAASGDVLIEGFGIWPGTTVAGFPITTQVEGVDEVPIWFVNLAELEAACADGELTILELASLPSLRTGSAGLYQEQLHFRPPHPVSHSTVVASGTLDGGGSFELVAIEIDFEWGPVLIDFQ